jgi:DNA-binding response OmpR family regulator
MSSRASPVLEKGVEIVLISPQERDSSSIRCIFDRSQGTVHWFPTCEGALVFLREHSMGVVISNAELPDGCWKDVLGALSRFAPQPKLIVSSRLADEKFWAEVLNLGGYDVLLTPFEPEEVLRVCTGAWLTWKHELTELSTSRKTADAATDSHPADEMPLGGSGAA